MVDTRERYIGLLTIDSAQRALRAGISRLDQAWHYVDREYAALTPSTTFDQLIPVAMGSDFPIPIVDENNVLVGEVHRGALAGALADYEADTVPVEAQTSARNDNNSS